MATEFKIRTKESKGMTSLVVRCQSRVHGIDYRLASGLEVDIQAWNKSKKSTTTLKNFRDANPVLTSKMDEIKRNLDAALRKTNPPTKEEMREIIDSVVLAEARAAQQRRKEEKKRIEAEEQKMTLNKFIANFLKEIQNGSRKTSRGTSYALGTIKAAKTALKQFEAFQKEAHREYDFNDIDMQFYYDFTAYLAKREYNINSTGKIVKQLKTIMAAAEAEGYHNSAIYKNNRFKGTRVDVDSIYLTMEDLDALMKADISELEPAAELARDIFMVGVWTAQRISDYNNIKKDDIQTIKNRWIEDIPDPDNPGQTMPVIRQNEITYINIRQQKTGAKVSIPCRAELRAILEKYNFEIPHLEDQAINRLIKQIARKAGITQPVSIETTKGGVKKQESKEKCDLVMSHTARRTGATLMYLAGVDIYDIMKITGHTTPEMLKKYIKADQLDVVQKLTDKYDYFK
ncbi:Phage integrase SAM-like domain-containing protein [Bacteroidales bacterium WCE2004]|nr:Phage integrase SAM-like domain-containing protein [Bacteroidales bacterium WCE2004]